MKSKMKCLSICVMVVSILVTMMKTTYGQQIGNKMVVAGGGACISLASDGSVWTWGCNCSGEQALGFATKTQDSYGNFIYNGDYGPREVEELRDIVFVDTNASSMVAINNKGEVFTWGWNPDGRLGYIENYYKPKQVEG